MLGDDVDLTESGAPTAEGLCRLLEYTLLTIEQDAARGRTIFERSPVDYLAYAAACRGAWPPGEARRFLATHRPAVRAAIRSLDLIAYVPLPPAGRLRRPAESRSLRRRVDACLARALLEDAHGLFVEGRPPVVALPPGLEQQLSVLSRWVETGSR